MNDLYKFLVCFLPIKLRRFPADNGNLRFMHSCEGGNFTQTSLVTFTPLTLRNNGMMHFPIYLFDSG